MTTNVWLTQVSALPTRSPGLQKLRWQLSWLSGVANEKLCFKLTSWAEKSGGGVWGELAVKCFGGHLGSLCPFP